MADAAIVRVERLEADTLQDLAQLESILSSLTQQNLARRESILSVRLDVNASDVDANTIDGLLRVLEHNYWLSSLTMSISYPWLEELIRRTKTTKPSFVLKTFDLSVHVDDEGIAASGGHPKFGFTNFIDGSRPTSAEELTIKWQPRISVDGFIPWAERLRKLCLGIPPDGLPHGGQSRSSTAFGISVVPLVQSLTLMKSLEELTLSHAFGLQEDCPAWAKWDVSPEQHRPESNYMLPASLKKFTMTSDTRSCQPFLRLATFPPSRTNITLDLTSDCEDDLVIPHLVLSLREAFKLTAAGRSAAPATPYDQPLKLSVFGAAKKLNGTAEDVTHFGISICTHTSETRTKPCRTSEALSCRVCEDTVFHMHITGFYSGALGHLAIAVPYTGAVTTAYLSGGLDICCDHKCHVLRGWDDEERLLRKLAPRWFPSLRRLEEKCLCFEFIHAIRDDFPHLSYKLV